jgi:hypothetical protein
MSKPASPPSALFADDNQLQIFIESVRSLRKYQKLYARYPTVKNAENVADYAEQVDSHLERLPEARVLFF